MYFCTLYILFKQIRIRSKEIMAENINKVSKSVKRKKTKWLPE